MTTRLAPGHEGVGTFADTRVTLERATRRITWTAKGSAPVTMLAEDARAFALGVLMAVRRLDGT